MSNSPILLLILALWGLVLAPVALRMYDRTSPGRTLRRFHNFRSSLAQSRRMRVPVQVVTLRRGAPRREMVDTRAAGPPVAEDVARASARRAVVRRRRVVLVLLVAAVVATGVVSNLLSVVPVWTVALPAVALVGYLAMCRAATAHEQRVLGAVRAARAVERQVSARIEAYEAPTVRRTFSRPPQRQMVAVGAHGGGVRRVG